MASKPAIVIVHGSYQGPALYQHLRNQLEAQGYSTYCPSLPGSQLKNLVTSPSNPDFDADPPPGGHPAQHADSDVIKAVLKTLVEEQGKKVILVAHSSGGWTASEAAVPAYQFAKRKEKGNEGGIVGIFHIASFLIEVGESVASTFSGASREAPAWFTLHKSGLTTITDPEHFFFHDLPPSEASKWAKTLTACPFLESKLTNDSYTTLPLAYLMCEGDRVLPPAYQEALVKGTEDKSGRKIDVYRCRGGHEAFLSSPKWCADAVADFAEKNA